MKLNTLTSAVSIGLVALTLTACGSSSDGGATVNPTPTPPPANTPNNTQALVAEGIAKGLTQANAEAVARANSTLAPNSAEFQAAVQAALDKQRAEQNQTGNASPAPIVLANPTIDNFNTATSSSVGTTHYRRNVESTFDRVANRAAEGSSGFANNISTASRSGNPFLSNFVLGTERRNGVDIAVDSAGELVTDVDAAGQNSANKVAEADSIYNTSIAGKPAAIRSERRDGTIYEFGEQLASANYAAHAGALGKPGATIVTIQEVNAQNVEITPLAATDVAQIATGSRATLGSLGDMSGLVAYNQNSTPSASAAGRQRGVILPVFGLEENIYTVDRDGNTASLNHGDIAGAEYSAESTVYTGDVRATANDFTTRVFGKNAEAIESGLTGTQRTANSYVARYTDDGALLGNNVAAATLQNVQYGRLTNNIDTLTQRADTNGNDRQVDVIYRQFQDHGSRGSVDTYFYRGTNETTIAQMEALKARGGNIEYRGHALTYGIGPYVAELDNNNFPTAYGRGTNAATLGNFVQANYDVARNEVTGSIYNFINNDVTGNGRFVKQDLVTFAGPVSGNTIVGSSTRLGASPETGSLTASFYGANAEELGGNVSSVTRDAGYGTNSWGAVFGAVRQDQNGNYSTGQRP